MVRFIKVPNEILLLIGEQLDNHADRWNLIFVSRHFHELFLTLVYRKVRLNSWRDAYSFLRAITNRPFLAQEVRELDSSDWQRELIPLDDWEGLQNSAILNDRVEFSSYSPGETAQWEEYLAKGCGDAWVALMLPLLGQIQQLNIVYYTPTPCLDQTMQRAISGERPFRSQPVFQHLREVSLNHQEDLDQPAAHESAENGSNNHSPSFLLSLFQVPSMRSIVANSVVEDLEPDGEQTAQLRAGFSSITEIDLRRSSGNRCMYAMIASCPDLKSFKYQHSDSHLASHGFQPAAFYRSLTLSKQTLHTLWLDQYGDHYPFTSAGLNQTHDEWFGSMADFSALRELRIRLTNLLDIRYQSEPTTPLINCLPNSLQTLFIEGCEERHVSMLVSQLQTVVKNHKSRFPHLQCLDIEGAFRNVSADEFGDTSASASGPSDDTIKPKIMQAAEALHEVCASVGLELHVHDRAFSHNTC